MVNYEAKLVASWKWDETRHLMLEEKSGEEGILEGDFKIVDGVFGKTIQCNEFSTRIHFKTIPCLSESFTIEVWCALASYPWAWAPILDYLTQSPLDVTPIGAFRDPEIPSTGILFGINQNGQVGFLCGCECTEDQVDLNEGNLFQCTSPNITLANENQGGRVPLKEWVHLIATFDNELLQVKLFMNGNCVGKRDLPGPIITPKNLPLYMARQREKNVPMGGERPTSHSPIYIHLDGIIDGLKWYQGALNEEEIASLHLCCKPGFKPQFEPRILPIGPKGVGKFGAYYTQLKFYEEWDNLWRVDAHPDVIVRFDDDIATRLIFWRGTSYIPCWAAPKTGSKDELGNDEYIWYTNEFNETWGKDVDGCAEPMSDKMCRYSHVRIIENNDARVIIHWRYALVDVHYKFARINYNNWGDWSDGYWVVYPDGVAVRRMALKTEDPYWPHEFQESILVEGPGQKPEDLVDSKAVSLLNMKGEIKVYDWSSGCPKTMDEPERCNIQLINIKSKARPFLVVPDGPSQARTHNPIPNLDLSKPLFLPFSGGIHRENAIFPFWNHWPTAQIISDGRVAPAADRAGHSSFNNLREWQDYEITAHSRTKLMLEGFFKGTDEQIIPLAKSWLQPPELVVLTKDISNNGYDATERAYKLTISKDFSGSTLKFEINASKEHPIVNFALIVNAWGDYECRLRRNGEEITRGKEFRYAHHETLERTDLIIFHTIRSEEKFVIELERR